MVVQVNQFKQSSMTFPSHRSGKSPSQAIFSPLPLLGSTTVLRGLELCSSNPETHNCNCSSWPLGLPSQRNDLFRSDLSARLTRTPKRRRQSLQAKKFSPERTATNTTSVFHRRSCKSSFYPCKCSDAVPWFFLSP